MGALKIFDLKELLKRQAMLDEKFDKKETVRERTKNRIIVAYLTELGEISQELKNEWSYWKNSTEKFNQKKVLEELSDLLHFYLSYLNFNNTLVANDYPQDFQFEDSLEETLISLKEVENKEKYIIFGLMYNIVEYVGATEEEFLQVHHEKWLKNMNERTKEEY